MITARANPAAVKVICVGLGRTGVRKSARVLVAELNRGEQTMSIRDALAMLGFGPCYHPADVAAHGDLIADLATWSKIGDGNGTAEDFDTLLRGYGCVLDYPAAMYHAELHAYYPDAKFILSTRNPAEWERSMKATVLAFYHGVRADPNRSGIPAVLSDWAETYIEKKYHRGCLETHAQQEFLDHIERVKQAIPADKLLVYEIGEGWDSLVEFLGVQKPEMPFPHVNDTKQFQKNYLQRNTDLATED